MSYCLRNFLRFVLIDILFCSIIYHCFVLLLRKGSFQYIINHKVRFFLIFQKQEFVFPFYIHDRCKVTISLILSNQKDIQYCGNLYYPNQSQKFIQKLLINSPDDD